MHKAAKNIKIVFALLLAMLLVLLTVGLPVTYNAVKNLKSNIAKGNKSDNGPYSNTNEEKTPSSTNISVNEEYTHHAHHDFNITATQISIAYIHAHEATYRAYHGELHYPPPNFWS